MRIAFLFLAAFLASAVEMVEALTIVLAVGVTRGWRSTLIGVGAAAARARGDRRRARARRSTRVPIDALRLVVGALLLVFGLQWLRKAILRASGYKALHDEDAIFARARGGGAAPADDERAGLDWYSFTLSFKGVFLEGLEVAFIVVTFGSDRSGERRARRSRGGRARSSSVAVAGVARPRAARRVPENTLKFAVGMHADDVRHLLGRPRARASTGRAATPRCSASSASYVAVAAAARPAAPPRAQRAPADAVGAET